MGTKGNRKKRQPSPSHPGPIHANRCWSDCSPAFRRDAEALMQSEKGTPHAGRLADKFAKRYPESPLASHLAGHAQLEGEDAGRALPHLRRASTLQPNCLEISHSLASAHMALQQIGPAADECRRALAVQDPTDPALHTVAVSQPPPAGPPDSDPAAPRVVFAKERLRALLAKVWSLPATALHQLCSGMTELQLQSFLHVPMKEVTAFCRQTGKPGEQQLATSLEAALEFGKATNTLEYWVCPQCNCNYSSAELFSSHMEEKHTKTLSESFTCAPKRVSDEQLESLVSWDPVPGVDMSSKGDSGCKGHASMLSQIKSLLIRLSSINALSVDLMNKLCTKGEDLSFSEKLNAIASLETEALQTVASRLRLIAPADWYHEKRCDGDHDTMVHFRIEEETIVLDFGDGNANGSVNRDLLVRWLCKPVHERSWTSTRQDCIINGAEVLADFKAMTTSLEELITQRFNSTYEEDYFDRKACLDVEILRIADALESVKKRLAGLCRFDYSAIILPALKAYLNAQMSSLLNKKLDGSGVSPDQSHEHEQLQPDKNVSHPHQEAKSHDETKKQPDTPTTSYASAHRTLVENAKISFLKCLREFKRNPAESSFYPGELKAMVHRRSNTFCVYYKHTEQYDDLAKSLSLYYDRIKGTLQEALIQFIQEQDMEKECTKVSMQPPELYIDGLPPPGSIQALAAFTQKEKNALVDEVAIYGNPKDFVLVLTELGMNLYLGFLRSIIEQHKKGKSWNGILSIQDLQVRNGSFFEISKEALVDATRKTMAEDFNKLAELLKAFFQKKGLRPVYFAELEVDLAGSSKMLGTCASDQRTITFQRYLLSHLALKSAMARGHLWLDLYRVHQLLGRVDQESLRTHLSGVAVNPDWTTFVENHPMLKQVFDEGLDPKGTNSKRNSTNNYYGNSMLHLLLFMRHVTQHGPDHTKNGEKGAQQLRNLKEADLIMAKYLPEAIMQLIHHLRGDKMEQADKFIDVWKSFSASR